MSAKNTYFSTLDPFDNPVTLDSHGTRMSVLSVAGCCHEKGLQIQDEIMERSNEHYSVARITASLYSINSTVRALDCFASCIEFS